MTGDSLVHWYGPATLCRRGGGGEHTRIASSSTITLLTLVNVRADFSVGGRGNRLKSQMQTFRRAKTISVHCKYTIKRFEAVFSRSAALYRPIADRQLFDQSPPRPTSRRWRPAALPWRWQCGWLAVSMSDWYGMDGAMGVEEALGGERSAIARCVQLRARSRPRDDATRAPPPHKKSTAAAVARAQSPKSVTYQVDVLIDTPTSCKDWKSKLATGAR